MEKVIEVQDQDFAGIIEWELSENATNALKKLSPESEEVITSILKESMQILAGNLTLCVVQENPDVSISLLKTVTDGAKSTLDAIRKKLSS